MPTYVVTGPDGKRYRVTAPEGATEADVMARVSGQAKPTSFWQGVAEGIQKPATNAVRMFAKTNPIGMLADAATGVVRNTAVGMDRGAEAAKARSPYQGSTAGRITGGIVGSLPTALLPGGAVAQGAYGGAAMTNDINDVRGTAIDAAIGATAGKLGQQVGKRVLAPVAERIGRTAPVRRLGEAAAKAVGKAPLPLPKVTKAERVVARATPDLAPVRQNVADAARLKLPYALADADPRLRTLGGSVARFSPDARAMAEKNFGERALGQADRAVNSIDELLAPITDIAKRGDEIMAAGANKYKPLYEQAYANPPVSSPRLEEILQTPAGRQAVSRANTIAANEFRDPRQLGFVLDADGNVVLDPTFSFGTDEAGNLLASQGPARQQGLSTQSLDYVKRGMDDILEQYRDPISNRLQLDESGRAINGVKNSLLAELDRVNPDYAAARSAYQQFAQRKSALNTGHDVLPKGNLPQRSFDAIMARATPETLPEMQRGYATALADTVNRQRLSGNPYNAIYGSPDQQAKVGMLFPQGSKDFSRLYDLEKEMAKTATETLGGSQTQPRAIADSMFQNDMANSAADAGIQMVTGGGVPGATKILGELARAAKDRSQLGLLGAKNKADALAPQLFDTSNPQGILDFLDGMARKAREEELRKQAYQRTFGLLGVPSAAVGVGSTR